MNREYHRWFSPSLQRDMEMLVFGHAGARVLVFPTSMGRFFQWEDSGMISTLSDQLEQGNVQLFCVDSVDEESWYARWKNPANRAWRQTQYDNYLVNEVLPLSVQHNSNPYLISVGTSFGAYHAINFAFRHPYLVNRVLGMSGFYNIKRFTGDYSDDNVYFNNPCDFIKNEHDPARLEALQHQDIILAIGSDDPSCSNNEYFSGILWGKGIWHALRIWNGWNHDWPYWQQMVRTYLSGHD
jgi:esterase/lipase superfamily enzyme